MREDQLGSDDLGKAGQGRAGQGLAGLAAGLALRTKLTGTCRQTESAPHYVYTYIYT